MPAENRSFLTSPVDEVSARLGAQTTFDVNKSGVLRSVEHDKEKVRKARELAEKALKSKCPLRPLHNHVVVIREFRDEQAEGGVVVGLAGARVASRGVVAAVGPGLLREDGSRVPMESRVGDRVVFSDIALHEEEIDGVTFCILSDTSMFATFDTKEVSLDG